MSLDSPAVDLKAGARARLRAVQEQLTRLRGEIRAHEAALAALNEQLPDLEFEEAAMRFILEGTVPEAAAASATRTKLSRPELIEWIRERMMAEKRALEVAELHRMLDEAGIDLGANARNYLCGVLSRAKEVHFVNVDKGAWWLAGQPLPPSRP